MAKPANSRRNAGLFKPGVSGNPKGRAKGTPNKVTAEIRELARKLFDEAYFERVRADLHEGKLPPGVEVKLLAYAFGEPKQELEHSGELTIGTRVVHEHRPSA